MAYDEIGRQDAVYLPTGTIDRTVFDDLGRVVSAWVGTSDTHTGDDWTPATNTGNMIDVQDSIYDNGGVGDSNLTETIQHPDPIAADARVTLNLFDWRDDLIASKQGALLDSNGNPNPAGETDGVHRLITATSYDNLDEAVATATYAGDGIGLGDFATWMPSGDASHLRAYSTQSFDDQGRAYLGLTYSVDPTSGTVGASLATNVFFDHRGNEIEESDPGGLVTKHQFDGAGRDVKDSTTDGGVLNGAAQNWTNAGTTVNDVVLEQTLSAYDGDDNVILSVDRQRFDSDPTTATGDLAGPAGGSLASRDYYTANYFDAALRLTDSVNVGTNGGVVWVRPASVPTGSDTVLVTHDDYDLAGYVLDTVDPRGIKSGTFHDMLGRQIETIAAWDGTSNPTPTSDTNQITAYTFDGDDDVLTMTAVMPSGTPSQTTAWIYGVGGTIGTNLFSNDLITKIEYPNASTGQASTAATDDQSFGYDNLGEKISFADQNGTTHGYLYDVLARMTADIATTLGSGVDGFIRRLGYSFNDAGLPFQQTSYFNTAGNNIANQVQDTYNGYGQLTAEYQNNAGAVNTSTTPAVLYGYAQPAGANYSRPSTLTYPGGRILDYDYISGIDTTISRLSGMSDPKGTNIEAYSYLGLDTIIRKIRPGSVLTLVKAYGAANGDAGDIYTGLDRFGRVADQEWVTSDTPNGTSGDSLGTVTDRFQYGYDPDSNVLYRANGVNSAYSELYHANGAGESTAYDPLNRLTGFRRGMLSASGNNGSTLDTVTTASASDSWTLDALGNSINEGGIPRTFNAKNQLTTYNGLSTITYDHDGNMTTDQAGNTYHFDAWNRMVSVYLGSNPNFPSEFWTYDALGRRPGLTITNGGITNSYYSANWQDLEDDGTLGVTHTVNTFVWSESYIDDVVARDQSVNGGAVTRIYAQQDANHDVTSIVNASGTVLQRFAYAPYGSRIVLTAAWAVTSDAYGWLMGLQGGRFDPLTGLVNFRFRDLNTGLDVWMEADPTGYADGANLYALERANTVISVDPFGTKATGPWKVNLNGSNGDFVMLMTVYTNYDKGDKFGFRSGASANIHYVPKNNCPSCPDIEVIQIMRHWTPGINPGTIPWKVDWLGAPLTDAQVAQNRFTVVPWMSNPAVLGMFPYYGHGGVNIKGHWQDVAFNDNPNMVDSMHGDEFAQYEDFVVCVDTGKVLDAMSWGYHHQPDGGMPSGFFPHLVPGTPDLQQALNGWNTRWPKKQFHFQ